MPHIREAELIKAVGYMPGPVRAVRHGRPDMYRAIRLGCYVSKTDGLDMPLDNMTVRLDDDNEFQCFSNSTILTSPPSPAVSS